MEHLICVMDTSGDSPIAFRDDSSPAVKQAAEALFERLLSRGHRAVNVHRTEGRQDEFISKFCQIENETLIIPPVVGG